jgi:uncharacterized membrane protein YbhN (UPF0104 family)
MLRLIAGQAAAVGAQLGAFRPELLIAALAGLIVANAVAALFWRAILRACGAPADLPGALRTWFLAAAAKYGLGALSHYASRVYLAEQHGTPRRSVVLALGIELTTITLSGLAVLLALVPLSADLLPFRAPPAWLLAGPVLALLLLAALPRLIAVATGLLPGGWRLPASRAETVGQLRVALVCALANWLLAGAALFLVTDPRGIADPSTFPAVLFAATLAVLGGLLAFTPFGLGVRDLLMAVLLAQHLPLPAATAAALLHRLLVVASELVCAAAALLLSGPGDRTT